MDVDMRAGWDILQLDWNVQPHKDTDRRSGRTVIGCRRDVGLEDDLCIGGIGSRKVVPLFAIRTCLVPL